MQNRFYFSYEMPTIWSSEVNQATLEQVKVVEKDYDYMPSIFLKTETMCTKLVPETVNYKSFTSKFIWNYLNLYH